MTRPVSILVRTTGARAELELSLAALLAELERRGAGDEVLLLDESGTRELSEWAAQRFPPPATFERASCELRTLALGRASGAGAALRAGAAEATHALLFLMDPALRVRERFLEPLCAALEDPRVFAAAPLLSGAVSAREPRWVAGVLECAPAGAGPGELAFLPLEAALVRRDDLLARAFDPLFEPGAWLARDLGWRARRDGRRLLRVAGSQAELAGGGAAPGALEEGRARLVFTWKHLDEEELWREHLAALLARTLRAAETGERAELLELALALEDLPALSRSRPSGASQAGFRALLPRGGEGDERDA